MDRVLEMHWETQMDLALEVEKEQASEIGTEKVLVQVLVTETDSVSEKEKVMVSALALVTGKEPRLAQA